MANFDRMYDLVKTRYMSFCHDILELNMSINIAECMSERKDWLSYVNEVKKIKRQIGHDRRVVVPDIHIRDDGFLIDNSFAFHIWGVHIFRCQLDHEREFFEKSLKAIDVSIRAYLPEIRRERMVFERI